VECGDQLLARLTSGAALPSVILMDVLLPDSDGLELIGKMKDLGVHVPVIVLSGASHVRTVVEAMKLGACDFLLKPFDENALEQAIDAAVESFTASQQRIPASAAGVTGNAGGFVTRNPQMRRLAEVVRRVAHTDVPLLIAGESGVGKEVMAKHAHAHSGRQDRPFLKVNCAALPHELLESELFGYERGAFTGAVSDKQGKFELAHGGTLLLDEIGEMSPLLQAKLLHVLQDNTFFRLGGRKIVQVDVRIIAATNIDIEKAVSESRFREDLYFRLNVIRIDLPPLRERKEDIAELCRFFIEKYREQYNSSVRELPPDLLDRFVHYRWPGNIRQLENCIRRFLVLPDRHALFTEFGDEEEPVQQAQPFEASSENYSLLHVGAHAAERAEQELVRRILEETHGNRKLAATRMNICYKALLNKLKRWNGPTMKDQATIQNQ
jgi:two-component system response regulator AtoC